jgi:16S rRNA (guanine527-N7)-methyltransferase
MTHTGLLEVVSRARSLGFTGPGEPRDHIEHALRFVELAQRVLPPPPTFPALPVLPAPLDGGPAPHFPMGDVVGGSDGVLHHPFRGVDLGSGGGVPGLVLAVALPWVHWLLVDSMQRRTTILDEAVVRLGLEDRVTVWCGRAEELGHAAEARYSADLVVARSFGPPAVTAECAAPLLRMGGHLMVSEPPESSGTRWPPVELEELGLEPVGVDLGVMVMVKVAETPDQYPRRVGIPAKRPLF